jgi:hypothetical protein
VLVLRDKAALLPGSDDRTLERQRAEIRALLGFHKTTVAGPRTSAPWLRDTVVARTRDVGELAAEAEARCGARRIRAGLTAVGDVRNWH